MQIGLEAIIVTLRGRLVKRIGNRRESSSISGCEEPSYAAAAAVPRIQLSVGLSLSDESLQSAVGQKSKYRDEIPCTFK